VDDADDLSHAAASSAFARAVQNHARRIQASFAGCQMRLVVAVLACLLIDVLEQAEERDGPAPARLALLETLRKMLAQVLLDDVTDPAERFH
jgi:hypothetical protein